VDGLDHRGLHVGAIGARCSDLHASIDLGRVVCETGADVRAAEIDADEGRRT